MSEKAVLIVGRVLKAVLSVLAVVAGAALFTQVLRIYSLGGNPYNAEVVAKYFSQIAGFVWAFIAVLVLAGAFFIIYPEKQKTVVETDGKKTLARLKNRLPLSNKEYAETYSESVLQLKRGELYRKAAWIAMICGCAVSACACFAYLLKAENFAGKNVTAEVKAMTIAFLPYLVASFLAFVAAFAFEKISLKKETAAVKSLFAESVKNGVKPSVQPEKKGKIQQIKEKVENALFSKKGLIIIRSAIAALCVVLVIVGIANGGMEDVLGKAKRICQECIGLG